MSEDVFSIQEAKDILIPMGITSEVSFERKEERERGGGDELDADFRFPFSPFAFCWDQNVAKQFGITREVQDRFAARSFEKAGNAQKEGRFKSEIVPVAVSLLPPALLFEIKKTSLLIPAPTFATLAFSSQVKQIDPKTGESHTVVVDADDGIRAGTTFETLSKLKPAFAKDGTTHAGKCLHFNLSSISRDPTTKS